MLKLAKIFEFEKTNIDQPLDFIRTIISESSKLIFNIDQFKNINQIKFSKELVKVVKSLVKLIIFNPNKAEIVTRNKEIEFFEFIIRILNSVSVIPLIIKMLKITIKENVKDNSDVRSKNLIK